MGCFRMGMPLILLWGNKEFLVHHKIYMTKKEEYGIIKIYVL